MRRSNRFRKLCRQAGRVAHRGWLQWKLGGERLPAKPLDELFPGISELTLTLFGGALGGRPGTLPLPELLSLAAICRYLSPERVIEIGTFTGVTTRHLAANSAATTQIITLDLPPGSNTSQIPFDAGNVTGSGFEPGSAFKGRIEAAKIDQVYGDSAVFDFTEYRRRVGMVFVDGNHSYEAVRLDSGNALAMVQPGGVVVWDDYHPEWGPEVMRYLEEIRDLGLTRIAGTRLVVYRQNATAC